MIFLRAIEQFPAHIVGLLIMFIMAVRFFAVPGDRRRTEIVLCASVLTVALASLAMGSVQFESRLVPLKYDLYIYWMSSFFGHPSFTLGLWLRGHAGVREVFMLAYDLLPTACLSLFSAFVYCAPEELSRVFKTFAVVLFLAPLFYFILPVCGPVFAFPTFPVLPAAFVPHPILLTAAPNGVPSVHTSLALLIAWFAWRWPLGRLLGSVYLVLILLSTLASGQHYLFDLIAAVPYTAVVLYAVPYRLDNPPLRPVPLQGVVPILSGHG